MHCGLPGVCWWRLPNWWCGWKHRHDERQQKPTGNEEASWTSKPLDVYLHGSDPTNDELPPDDLFGAYDPDDPDITPLGRLLYGTSEPPPDPDEDLPHVASGCSRLQLSRPAVLGSTRYMVFV